ncbi:MAG TPA: hypothetical protein VEG31_04460 [Thermoproteota archaeon]|nr:hypothetical protein [Thermoproteota archaeon]
MIQQKASPRLAIVALGAVIASVWVFAQIYMAETTGSYVTGEGAFLSTTVVAWICMSFALQLAPVDFAALFAIVEGASASSILLPALVGLPIVLGLPTTLNWGTVLTGKMSDSLPLFFGPNQAIAVFATLGGAPIPFSTLLPTIVFAVALNSLMWISLSAQMFILREKLYSLRTVSYPVPSATHVLVKEVVSGTGGASLSPSLLSGFSLGFLLVSFTEGYLSSSLFNGFFLLPAGLTSQIYGLMKQVLPGSLLGLDIFSSVPYIWFLLFVPSSVSATVSIAGVLFYLLVLPVETGLGVIPTQYLKSYTELFSASQSLGLSSFWIGVGLFLSSAAGIFVEKARVQRPKAKDIQQIIAISFFVVPPVLLAWALGSSVLVIAVVMAMSIFSVSIWSARGLAEVNMAYAPSDVVVAETWPFWSKTLGLKPICYTDSTSFFLGGYLSVASSIGAATSLESVKFGELLGQDHISSFSFFTLGSLIGLILGPVFYLWLLFRFGTQSRVLGAQVLDTVGDATGIYVARAYLIDHATPVGADPASLVIGGVTGLGVPFLLNYLFGIAVSPYAMALGVLMSPATTIIPYAFVSLLRRTLFERNEDTSMSRQPSLFAVGLAAGAISVALISTVLSTLS